MKNIFLTPTDKPSNLFILVRENFYKPEKNILSFTNIGGRVHLNDLYKPQNIYITSSEEIKDGDWCIFNRFPSVLSKATCNMSGGGSANKVVLTNDPTLISDGVQKIDDSFLQWFVNNSNCEFVEVEKEKVELGEVSGTVYIDFKYNIIIPQKNFYCGEEVDYGDKCGFQCEGCNDAIGVDYGFLPQEKIKHKVTALITEERSSAYEFIDFDEALSEFIRPIKYPTLLECGEFGVKWAQEKIGKEESTANYIDRHIIQAMVEVAKQKLYTKEDMLEAFNAGNKRGHSGYPNTDNWTQPTFEDFLREKEIKTE